MLFIFFVFINLLNIVKFIDGLSFDLESKYLYQLNNGCKNVDIRFHTGYFENLKNCKTIHGFLRISDIAISNDFTTNNSFVDLREITGYFLVSNVSELHSLSHLFPNLSVIRGNILHNNENAMVIINNDDLQNIGLKSLTYISNGNVRIERNEKLCYVETIDWTKIRDDLKVVNENNKRFCKNTCDNATNCWSFEILQKSCDGCQFCTSNKKCCNENCIGGCFDDDPNKCVACKEFYHVNESRCTSYEPNTFELENHFLVDADKCDEYGRTRLDHECLKIDECPMHEKHFYSNLSNSCAFCPTCIRNCSIEFSDYKKLQQFNEDCHIATKFVIENIYDNIIDIQAMFDEKFSNIVEIQSCLIIRNSSGVLNLNFLKRLKKISGSCDIDGEKYSILIEHNKNLQHFIPNFNIQMKDDGKVKISNNEKLCQSELKVIKNISSNFEIQDEECRYQPIKVKSLSTENSALILIDGIDFKKEDFTAVLNFQKYNEIIITVLKRSYFEVKALEPNTTYKFKIELLDGREQTYLSNYHFVKTLAHENVIQNYESEALINGIKIGWELAHTDENSKDSDFVYYITYKAIDDDFCNKTKYQNIKDTGLINNDWYADSRPFHRYHLKDPSNIPNFENLNFFEMDFKEKSTVIRDLSATCYQIDIFVCKRSNILLCKLPFTIIENSLLSPDEISIVTDSVLPYIIASVVICCVIVTILIHFYFLYKTKIYVEEMIEMREVNMNLRDKWEIKHDKVIQTKFLGRGEFGIVYEGYIKPYESKLFAIKTLAETKELYEENFRSEARIMRKFDAHHVVKLVGYCLKDKPLLVIMELMTHGDLKKFLQKNKPIENQEIQACNSCDYSLAPINKNNLHPIKPVHEMAIEIADGMKYLEDMSFIHCDLACRNCMVYGSYTIKIGDFGMARELYHSDYYKPGTRNKKIPIRWMAPETLPDENFLPKYTHKSDVFSYGIVLFELVTYCEKPYAQCMDEDVIRIIKMGKTMERPMNCDDKIYDLMIRCWRYNPDDRIKFRDIIKYLIENYKIPYSFKRVSHYHNAIDN